MNLPGLKKDISVFWWDELPNIGDQLNPYLIDKISDGHLNAINVSKGHQGEQLLCVGSIIHYANPKTTIWGSGLIADKSQYLPKMQPEQILAVRGPLTRDILTKNGFVCPPIYGDPGILMREYYQNHKIKKKFEIGLIPHFVDKSCKVINQLTKRSDVKLIDVETSNVERFIDDILECETIFSSSLHGLILADSYNIPNVWVSFDSSIFKRTKIVGKGFKFRDYNASVKKQQRSPVLLKRLESLSIALDQLELGQLGSLIPKLLESCPFKN